MKTEIDANKDQLTEMYIERLNGNSNDSATKLAKYTIKAPSNFRILYWEALEELPCCLETETHGFKKINSVSGNRLDKVIEMLAERDNTSYRRPVKDHEQYLKGLSTSIYHLNEISDSLEYIRGSSNSGGRKYDVKEFDELDAESIEKALKNVL